MSRTRSTILSGYASEADYGYSRAVRVGNTVYVSGTTARGADLQQDVYVQAKAALAIVEEALIEAGAALSHTVRTVAYVTDMDHMDAVAQAHREAFADCRPASTIVQIQALSPKEALIEFEITAEIHDEQAGAVNS